MNRTGLLFLALAMLVSLGGCATSFTGSAYIEGGASGCEKKCSADGLAMSGVVYMGEYSSACVCEKPGAKSGAADSGAGASASAVGVIMRMREADRQNDDSLVAVGSLQ